MRSFCEGSSRKTEDDPSRETDSKLTANKPRAVTTLLFSGAMKPETTCRAMPGSWREEPTERLGAIVGEGVVMDGNGRVSSARGVNYGICFDGLSLR